MRLSLCSDCDCKSRQEWLNNRIPGLGDSVAIVFNPIQQFICPNENGETPMKDILKPDLKSLVWLGVGFLVVPFIMSKLK